MDWSNCIVCRKSEGNLICPANRPNAKQSYTDFLQIVNGFLSLDKLPTQIIISGKERAEDFVTNSAKWNKSCLLKFVSSKLACARERHARSIEDDPESLQRKSPRLSEVSASTSHKLKCIFCESSEGLLHSCSTFNLDTQLRGMATKLQDIDLLSRISSGDLVAIDAKYHSKCMLGYKNRFRSF